MTTDAIYKERGSDWSHQVSVVATTQWLQRDQTLPLSVKGVAFKTMQSHGRKPMYKVLQRPMKKESREDKLEYQEGQEWLHGDGLNKARLVHKTL